MNTACRPIKATGTVTLTATPEGVWFSLNDAAPADLFDPAAAEYTGPLKRSAPNSDGWALAPVKEYVFGLADNPVQQRRGAGFKTASLSMHMIFTGNPGTGKTTIARLVAKVPQGHRGAQGLASWWR